MPWIHRERAILARRLGNVDDCRRDLAEARRLFKEMGIDNPDRDVAEETRALAVAVEPGKDIEIEVSRLQQRIAASSTSSRLPKRAS